jgi:hypothetical protein
MKTLRLFKPAFFVIFVAICAINRCTCDDESLEVPSEIDVFGTWILKSAEFQNDDVDLDREGPMGPVKDIKYLLLGWLDVYANCSSIEEIPLRFSEDLSEELTSANPTKNYIIYAVCPLNQGITSQIATFYIDVYQPNAFYIEVEKLNDPGDLIEWGGSMHVYITNQIVRNGVRELQGTSSLIPKGSGRYQHFDFVLEEYN